MIKIPRMSDRYKFKIEELEFTIAPLSRAHKIEITSCSKVIDGETVPDLLEMQHLYLKYGLKEVKGVQYHDGEDFVLSFENGHLTDESVSEISNIPQKSKLMVAAWQCLNGAPDEITDTQTGKKLDGVELEIVSGKPGGA